MKGLLSLFPIRVPIRCKEGVFGTKRFLSCTNPSTRGDGLWALCPHLMPVPWSEGGPPPILVLDIASMPNTH